MKNWTLYRAALRLLPVRGKLNETELTAGQTQTALRILRKHRCAGAALCLFDDTGAARALTYGQARQEMPVRRGIRER